MPYVNIVMPYHSVDNDNVAIYIYCNVLRSLTTLRYNHNHIINDKTLLYSARLYREANFHS